MPVFGSLERNLQFTDGRTMMAVGHHVATTRVRVVWGRADASGRPPDHKEQTLMATSKPRPRRVKVPGEPYIYERPGREPRIFEIVWRDAERNQHVRKVDGGIMAARAERDRILGDRATGHTPAEPRLTFGKAANAWLESLQSREMREETRAEYGRHIARLSGWHTRRLNTITTADLRRLLAALRGEGLGERSLALHLGTVGRVFRFAAAELRWRGQDPTRLLERADRPRARRGHAGAIFEGDQLERTVAAAHEPFATLFKVMAGTGCRISEAVGLRLDDLILDDDPRIAFRRQMGRDGAERTLKTEESEGIVPITDSLAAALRAHLARTAERGIPGDYVFATRSGRPLGQRNVARELRRAQSVAKRPDGSLVFPILNERDARGEPVPVPRGAVPGLHSFRHTLATRMSDAGATAEEIQRQLRHADSTVTRAVYIRELSDQERRRGQRERIAGLVRELEDEL
jgi:integrase